MIIRTYVIIAEDKETLPKPGVYPISDCSNNYIEIWLLKDKSGIIVEFNCESPEQIIKEGNKQFESGLFRNIKVVRFGEIKERRKGYGN